MTRARVQVTYCVQGHKEESRNETFGLTATPGRVGLPLGSTPQKPAPGDIRYSGMHDGGALPELKEGSEIAALLSSVKAAKDFNDQFLSRVIEEQKVSQDTTNDALHPSKRSRRDGK